MRSLIVARYKPDWVSRLHLAFLTLSGKDSLFLGRLKRQGMSTVEPTTQTNMGSIITDDIMLCAFGPKH